VAGGVFDAQARDAEGSAAAAPEREVVPRRELGDFAEHRGSGVAIVHRLCETHRAREA
jgi:hypothetical protein